jgi:hypothetical protein
MILYAYQDPTGKLLGLPFVGGGVRVQWKGNITRREAQNTHSDCWHVETFSD